MNVYLRSVTTEEVKNRNLVYINSNSNPMKRFSHIMLFTCRNSKYKYGSLHITSVYCFLCINTSMS